MSAGDHDVSGAASGPLPPKRRPGEPGSHRPVSHDKEVDPMPIAHAKWFVENPAHHQADWGSWWIP
jgi:hypothetical protein